MSEIGAMPPASISHVVARGICVGCGGCGAVTDGRIPVTLGRFGSQQAVLDGANAADLRAGSAVCPFAHESPNEDAIADDVFSQEMAHDPRLGRFLRVSAAQVADDDYLQGSSSGGMTSWIAGRLLRDGHVDGLIHVGKGQGGLFGYTVSSTVEELASERKSAYYSTTMAQVLKSVSGDGKRYAVIGVPCFITAARLLARQSPPLAEQLAYFIGLVCGHLKSSAFAELLAWQTGVAPDELESVDFRVKYPDRDAGDYGFSARRRGEDAWRTRPNRELMGANWGHAMLQLNACNFCDDIFAETADVALGDAWLEGYRDDWRGTNVVITRNPLIQQLLDSGADAGELRVDPLTADDAARSQGGNFRHRRDGLQVRLADDAASGEWVPLKRVEPGYAHLPARRVALVRKRRELSDRSHALFAEARERGSLRHYIRGIRPLVRDYSVLDLGPLLGNLTHFVPWLVRSRLFRTRLVRRVLSRRRQSAVAPPTSP